MSNVLKESSRGGWGGCGSATGDESAVGVFLGVRHFFEKQLGFHNLNIIIRKTSNLDFKSSYF